MTADINPPPLVFAEPPPMPSSPGRVSKLAVAGFILALLAIPTVLVLAIGLFQQVIEGPNEEAGPMILVLFIASWLGFLGAIFGAVSLRQMRGPAPFYRGRGFALFSTAGARAAQLATVLAFVSIPIGSALGAMHGAQHLEFKVVQSCWWVAALLVIWYVGAMIRRSKRPATNRGLGALFSGIVFHLLLIFAVPASMVAAVFTLQQTQANNGRQPQRYNGSTGHGLYAMRDVRLTLPKSPETPVTIRLWENGQQKDIGSLTLSGSIGYRWKLAESLSGAHTLTWEPIRGGGSAESRQLDLPSDVDLMPVTTGSNQPVQSGKTSNIWLFLPFDQALRNAAPDKSPDWGIELVVGTPNATIR